MTTPDQHVFFDPSGRRRRVLNRATLVAGIATGVVAVVFVVSLLLAPFVTPPGSAGTPARLTQGKPGSLIAPRRARVSSSSVRAPPSPGKSRPTAPAARRRGARTRSSPPSTRCGSATACPPSK
jgi:hypothetical protein